MIGALTSIGTTLCTMGAQAASVADISTALDKQHATENARAAEGEESLDAAYSYIQKSLTSRSNSHLKASQAVKRTWDQLNQLRSGLAADPVKDGGGNPIVPPVTPLACNLP